MPQVLEQNKIRDFPPVRTESHYSLKTSDEEIIYPEQRADDMGETSVHAKLINKLLAMLLYFFEQREDVFLSSNMNLYYEEGNPTKWFAPDLLIAFGASNHERSSYQVWKEKVFPQVIFEIASSSTWKDDISAKYEIYELSGVEEYYILDPEFAFLPAPLLAFQRQGERLVSVSVENGKVFSPRLGLEIIKTADSFRLFNSQTNQFLRNLEEAEAEVSNLKAEIERLKSQK